MENESEVVECVRLNSPCTIAKISENTGLVPSDIIKIVYASKDLQAVYDQKRGGVLVSIKES